MFLFQAWRNSCFRYVVGGKSKRRVVRSGSAGSTLLSILFYPKYLMSFASITSKSYWRPAPHQSFDAICPVSAVGDATYQSTRFDSQPQESLIRYQNRPLWPKRADLPLWGRC